VPEAILLHVRVTKQGMPKLSQNQEPGNIRPKEQTSRKSKKSRRGTLSRRETHIAAKKGEERDTLKSY